MGGIQYVGDLLFDMYDSHKRKKTLLDWLKFFPFAWNIDYTVKEVRGPYFAKPRDNKWPLGDCRLHFKAPWSNPVFAFNHAGRQRVDWHPFNAGIFKNQHRIDVNQGEFFAEHLANNLKVVYRNEWHFVGPWFSGRQDRLRVTGALLTTGKPPQDDINLFHPRVFESAVASYLDKFYGYTESKDKARYRGPLNWKRLSVSNSIQALQCDIHDIVNSTSNISLDRKVFIPIDPHRFVVLRFNFGDDVACRDMEDGTVRYHNSVCFTPQLKLCNAIIKSLRLEVGEKTQAAWNEVKATCPDMSLTDTMGEFKWPLKKKAEPQAPSEVNITPKKKAGYLEDAS